MTGPDVRESIARVLAGHGQSFGSNGARLWTFCRCNPDVELAGVDGGIPEARDPFYVAGIEAFFAHLADALLAAGIGHVPTALRDAAEDWDRPEHQDELIALARRKYVAGGPSMPVIWLRDRADRIEEQ